MTNKPAGLTEKQALSFVKKFESGKLPLNNDNLEKYYEACLLTRDIAKNGYFKCCPYFTMKMKQAIYLAKEFHYRHIGVERGRQLVSHLLRINRILFYYAKDRRVAEDLSIAGILHRIRECEDYPMLSCKEFFGWNVYHTVLNFPKMLLLGALNDEDETTEIVKWRNEMTSFLHKVTEAHYDGIIILCAAQIDRLGYFMRFYPSKGDKIWVEEGISKEDQMWFCNKTVEILRMKIDDKMVLDIVEGLKETIDKAIQIFENNTVVQTK